MGQAMFPLTSTCRKGLIQLKLIATSTDLVEQIEQVFPSLQKQAYHLTWSLGSTGREKLLGQQGDSDPGSAGCPLVTGD